MLKTPLKRGSRVEGHKVKKGGKIRHSKHVYTGGKSINFIQVRNPTKTQSTTKRKEKLQ